MYALPQAVLRCHLLTLGVDAAQADVALLNIRSRRRQRDQRWCADDSPDLNLAMPPALVQCASAGAKAVIAEVRKKHGDKVLVGGFPKLLTEVCELCSRRRADAFCICCSDLRIPQEMMAAPGCSFDACIPSC